jgi:hypothetical protein
MLHELTGQAWLDDHIEKFVKPVVGVVPDYKLIKPADTDNYTKMLTGANSIYPGLLVKLWTEAKRRAAGRTILLPGRDVWLFEVLARLEGTDTIFRPDISSNAVTTIAKSDPQKEVFKGCFCVDSCCAGSIPKKLGCADWALGIYSGFAANLEQLQAHQLIAERFPNLATDPLYNCYAILECVPKYWTHASASNGIVTQQVVPDGVLFRTAFKTTMVMANHWLENHKPQVVNEFNLEPEVSIRRTRIKKTLTKLKAKRRVA